jgi:putative ABC transport system permease protein
MGWWIFMQIAVRNLVQAKRRTFFLGLALGAVTMLLMLLLALSQGISDTMLRSATTLMTGHINVAGWFKSKPTDAAPILTNSKKLRDLVEQSVPGVEYVVDRSRGWGRVISDSASLQAGLTGILVEEESAFIQNIRLAEESEYLEGGRNLITGDITKLGQPNQALVFVGQAKRLNVRPGDMVTVTVETFQGARNTAEFTIAAVAKDVGFMSNWSFFASKESILRLYNLSNDTTGAIQIILEDQARSSEVMGQLRKVIADAGYELMDHDPQPFWMKFETVAGEDWTGQHVDLTIWSDEVSFLLWVLTAIDGISFLLIGILLIIIAIGIMNSMWIAVRERTAEIGTLRAIGMSRGRVLLMFLLEAVILGIFATTIGGIVGLGIAMGLDAAHIIIPVDAVQAILMSDVLHMVVDLKQLVGAVIVFSLVAGAAAFYPAFRASRMQPVTAIHHVG